MSIAYGSGFGGFWVARMTTTWMQRIAPRLRVRDVRAAAEWYRDQRGFTIDEYWPETGEPGFCHVALDDVCIQLTRMPEDEPSSNPPGTTNPGGAYVWVEDVAALYRRVVDAGVARLYDLERSGQ
jgi:catechol 2,3-dioxygenase-like lactoylglutathione lyase family enzyme